MGDVPDEAEQAAGNQSSQGENGKEPAGGPPEESGYSGPPSEPPPPQQGGYGGPGDYGSQHGYPAGHSPTQSNTLQAMQVPGAPATQPLGKKRNPFAVILLSLITLGIYSLYWYGAINAEIRRHDPRIHVRPGLAVLAQLVPFVNLVSGHNTAERVKRLEMADGMPSQISPVLSVLFLIFLGIGYPIQVQSHLNAHWDHHLMEAGLH